VPKVSRYSTSTLIGEGLSGSPPSRSTLPPSPARPPAASFFSYSGLDPRPLAPPTNSNSFLSPCFLFRTGLSVEQPTQATSFLPRGSESHADECLILSRPSRSSAEHRRDGRFQNSRDENASRYEESVIMAGNISSARLRAGRCTVRRMRNRRSLVHRMGLDRSRSYVSL
jgi:hypothetical protein